MVCLLLEADGSLRPCAYDGEAKEADYGLWWVMQNQGGCVIFQRFPHRDRPLDEPPLADIDGPFRITLETK